MDSDFRSSGYHGVLDDEGLALGRIQLSADDFHVLMPVWVPAVLVAMAILNLFYNLIESGPGTGERAPKLPKEKLPYYGD
ncbi:hypothetical protein [Rhizobium mongolense]|uniref:Uncharacterized protein n=1 Tax=Rhizobium mongolense TaxID=57676 RepID=A0ABR6IFC7_9HYPH|nr:hypothetical protein [Rhizobium mongolense]MBB4226572.1 hypothetical protein [Rhizobium mongolense]